MPDLALLILASLSIALAAGFVLHVRQFLRFLRETASPNTSNASPAPPARGEPKRA